MSHGAISPAPRGAARDVRSSGRRERIALARDRWHVFAAEAGRRGLAPAAALRSAALEILGAWAIGAQPHAAQTFLERARSLSDEALPLSVASDGLIVRMQIQEGDLLLDLEHEAAQYPEVLVADVEDALCELLRCLAAQPAEWDGRRRDPLPATQRARRARMNRTAHRWQGALVLHRPFLEHAERRPDAPAVIAAGGSLTYAELLGRARSLAGSLRAEGLRPGEPVIVAIDKSLEQVVAATGVLLAGSPYVPVAPGLPAARRQLLVAQTGARHVLVADTAVRASDWPRPLCLLAVPAGGAADGDVAIDEDALAYVIFTSGSTGTPKGVMVQHRAALNTVLDVNRRIALGPRDRALALSELSFDLSVYDVFGVLAAGGVVVMPEPHEMKNAAAWLERIARHEVTILNAVPALVQLLVSYAEARAVPLPRSLRAVLLSGDWIPVGLPDRIRALAPGCDVIGLGGATEASIWSVVYPIARVDPQWRSIPYGRPLANQTIHVLHPDLRDCPDWVPGELFIGGDGLAAGYWRDPERTRASFLVHPDTGERLYRTGDRARHLPDGNVEFLGRTDHQIKLNGYRIELGEIESMLRAHAEVAAAVVAVRSDGAGNRRLVGFVAPPEGCACDSGELRRFLSRQLPAYMVPSAIVTLPEIPLSGNGKIDRAALPDPWQGESARLGESGS